jgi:uncharacterized lipoprotein YbaY
MTNSLISGDIRFAERPSLPEGAKIYVSLLDISLADAPSKVVVEQVLTGIAEKANSGKLISFTIDGKIENAQSSYSISVLVDVDGDGKRSKGDFINMQSYPVLTFGHPSQVSVLVKPIK